MSARGTIPIPFTQDLAGAVSIWLSYQRPPWNAGLLGLTDIRHEADRLRGRQRQFRSIAARKRAQTSYTVRLQRHDVEWFANHVKPSGMFASRQMPILPVLVRLFFLQCLSATRAARGPRMLRGERLEQAIARERLDERRRKRLKARQVLDRRTLERYEMLKATQTPFAFLLAAYPE